MKLRLKLTWSLFVKSILIVSILLLSISAIGDIYGIRYHTNSDDSEPYNWKGTPNIKIDIDDYSSIPTSYKRAIALRRFGPHFISTIFSILILVILFIIFNRIPKEKLFNIKSAKYFRLIGFGILLSIISRYIFEEFTESLIWSHPKMEGVSRWVGSDAMNFEFFLIGLIFLVLAEVYYRVAQVQEDNKLII